MNTVGFRLRLEIYIFESEDKFHPKQFQQSLMMSLKSSPDEWTLHKADCILKKIKRYYKLRKNFRNILSIVPKFVISEKCALGAVIWIWGLHRWTSLSILVISQNPNQNSVPAKHHDILRYSHRFQGWPSGLVCQRRLAFAVFLLMVLASR